MRVENYYGLYWVVVRGDRRRQYLTDGRRWVSAWTKLPHRAATFKRKRDAELACAYAKRLGDLKDE